MSRVSDVSIASFNPIRLNKDKGVGSTFQYVKTEVYFASIGTNVNNAQKAAKTIHFITYTARSEFKQSVKGKSFQLNVVLLRIIKVAIVSDIQNGQKKLNKIKQTKK